MRSFAILLCSVLCSLAELAAGQYLVDVIYVGGEVPRPGPIKYEKGMTIETAVAESGLQLRQLNKGQICEEQACPIRVVIWRKGTKMGYYDPKIDAEKLRTTQVLPLDTVELKDFRTYQGKIDERRKRLSQMITLGSWKIDAEIRLLAGLQDEYAQWVRISGEKEPEPVDSFVNKEVARLTDEGKGQRTVDLLELRRREMELGGVGPGHPTMKRMVDLIELFTAQLHKIK
jgi:hypothetical protein